MNELASWFDRQSRAEKRVRLLEDTLMGAPFWPYALYRLRYFFLRLAVDYGVHVIRLFLVFTYFGTADVLLIFGAYALSGIATSFWWGTLESMRERVRWLRRTDRPHLVEKEISTWLAFATHTGIVIGIAVLFGLVLTVAMQGWRITPINALLSTVFLRVALNLGIRTYHSGVYSLRRVYRPPQAIVVAELAGFVSTIALIPLIGQWAFVAGSIVSIGASAGISFKYTRHAYRLARIKIDISALVLKPALPRTMQRRSWLWSGTSYAIMRVDSLILALIAGVAVQSRSLEDAELAILLFLAGPIIRAGFDWAQLFYFDFKRLEVDELRRFRKGFQRSLLLIAVPIGAFLWLIASVVASAVLWWNLGDLYWLLLQFFALRSILAVLQMERFSNRSYAAVLLSGASLFVGSFLAIYLVDGTHFVLAYLSAALAVAVLLLEVLRRARADRGSRGMTMGYLDWLRRLRSVTGPVVLYSATIRAPSSLTGPADSGNSWNIPEWQAGSLATRINRRLASCGLATVISGGTVAWFETHSATRRIDADWLVREAGGLVDSLRKTGEHPDGAGAIVNLSYLDLPGSTVRQNTGSSAQRVDIDDVIRHFNRMFPGGFLFSPGNSSATNFPSLASGARRGVVRDALQFLKILGVARYRTGYETTALSLNGEVSAIFAVDRRHSSRSDRRRWARMIREWNVQAALQGSV